MKKLIFSLFVSCFLVVGGVSAQTGVTNDTATNLASIKKTLNNQVMGLTALVEALGTEIKKLKDELLAKDSELEAIKACLKKQKFYDENTGECLDVPTGTPTVFPDKPCKKETKGWTNPHGHGGSCLAQFGPSESNKSQTKTNTAYSSCYISGEATFLCLDGEWQFMSGFCNEDCN